MKRAFDLVASLAGLIALAPILLMLVALIRWQMGAPVFFMQTRPGLNGQPFRMIKFRTMLAGDAPDAERLTPLGRFLRATSLDELPELINVVKGDMSLVGPRPLLMDYLPLYNRHEARRHEVRPGITGWAQINGRNALTWPEKFAHDVWYVDNQSLWLDLKILVRTITIALRREGISAAGEATMSRFTGSGDPS